jgi:DNA polymerase elongation subunit (family B)
MIKAFGVTAQGASVSVTVTGFMPSFLVKVDAPGWTERVRAEAEANLRRLTSRQVHRFDREWLQDFVGYAGGRRWRFLRLTFLGRRQMQWVAKRVARTEVPMPTLGAGVTIRLAVYEGNVDPLLRFLHQRGLRPAGWVRLDRPEPEKEDARLASSCQTDLTCDAARVHPAPALRDPAPLLLASFDLECNSEHGDFPQAAKDYQKLACLLVSAKPDILLRPAAPEYDRKRLLEGFLRLCLGLEPRAGSPLVQLHPLRAQAARLAFRAPPPAARLERAVDVALDDVYDRLLKEGGFDDLLSALNAAFNTAFPLAGDPVIQVGLTLACSRAGGGPVLSLVLALGETSPVEGSLVYWFAREADLLRAFAKLLRDADPDLVIGYNIMGFDFGYLDVRARQLGLERCFDRLGRLPSLDSKFVLQKTSSKGRGDNQLGYFDMHGRVAVDLLKVVQAEHRLASHKLDDVAKHFLGDSKDDLLPKDIFRLQRGGAEDRAKIAKYCAQDCLLVVRLAARLEVLNNNMGMANVCSVPLAFLFMRGQGIKILSLVARQCRADGFAIPTREREEDRPPEELEGLGDGAPAVAAAAPPAVEGAVADPKPDRYEGAIVLEPVEGLYMDDPVVVLDYASLYPSSMISENISHDTLVLDPEYGQLPGVLYKEIAFQDGAGGEVICRFAQPEPRGVLPKILLGLLSERKKTRARAKEPGLGPEQLAVLEGLQLAYKITANSLYGQMGAATSALYLREVAASTTATGRAMILKAKAYLEQEEGAEVIYGDSVARHTPVLVRFRDDAGCHQVAYERIDRLAARFGGGMWRPSDWGLRPQEPSDWGLRPQEPSDWGLRPQEPSDWGLRPQEPCVQSEKRKEACDMRPTLDAWTEAGWTPLRRVIRHALAPHKRMLRVSTGLGLVDVTDDHSLVRAGCLTPVAPRELRAGRDALLHAPLPKLWPKFPAPSPDQLQIADQELLPEHTRGEAEEAEARVMGRFFGDCAPCATKEDIWAPCASPGGWEIRGTDVPLLTTYLGLCQVAHPYMDWAVVPCCGRPACFHLIPRRSAAALSRMYRDLMVRQSAADWVVPERILGAPARVRRAFWQGLCDAEDGMGCLSQLCAATVFALGASLGVHPGFSFALRGSEGSRGSEGVCLGAHAPSDDPGNWVVREVQEVAYPAGEYVYDLTTDNHHFAAGPGLLVVHNTDSVFVKWPRVDASDATDATDEAPPDAPEATVRPPPDAPDAPDAPVPKGTSPRGGGCPPVVARAIERAQMCSRRFKPQLAPPHDLEFDKCFFPLVLVSKKRYVGTVFTSARDAGKFKSMGLVTTRRDNAPIVKTVYTELLDALLRDRSAAGAIGRVRAHLAALVEGRVPLAQLVVSKTLKATYKEPEKIAHNKLAMRMAARDPGSRPQPNDRVPYIYVQVADPKALQGDRIEPPEYVREHGLRVDYTHYITNQIQSPVAQLLATPGALEQLPGYVPEPHLERSALPALEAQELRQGRTPREARAKAKERWSDLRQKEVVRLLFEPLLQPERRRAQNLGRRQREITGFLLGPPRGESSEVGSGGTAPREPTRGELPPGERDPAPGVGVDPGPGVHPGAARHPVYSRALPRGLPEELRQPHGTHRQQPHQQRTIWSCLNVQQPPPAPLPPAPAPAAAAKKKAPKKKGAPTEGGGGRVLRLDDVWPAFGPPRV